MFLIDDLLSAPVHVLSFVLRKILRVKKYSSVRSAGPNERASPPSVREGRGHVFHRRSADGVAEPPSPLCQEDPDHQADLSRFGPRDR